MMNQKQMVVVRTPYRVSLFGGGTDFPDFYLQHGGAWLSLTLKAGITAVAKRRWEPGVKVHYNKTETVDSPGDLKHELLREALYLTKFVTQIEMATLGDIPGTGTGLGSSSSVTVAALHALWALAGIEPDAKKLAWDATHIELAVLQKPMGVQDQYAAAYGGLRLYTADGVQGVDPGKAPFYRPELVTDRLLLFYTGKTRKNGGMLATQRDNISAQTVILNRQAELAHQAMREITVGSVNHLGPMLHEAWQMKKQYHPNVTSSEVDAMYGEARRAGATGGKICGAGGGGFLLLFVPTVEAREKVRQALRHYRELAVEVGPGSEVVYEH